MDAAEAQRVVAALRAVAAATATGGSCPPPPVLPDGQLASLLHEAATLEVAVARSTVARLEGVADQVSATLAAVSRADRWLR